MMTRNMYVLIVVLRDNAGPPFLDPTLPGRYLILDKDFFTPPSLFGDRCVKAQQSQWSLSQSFQVGMTLRQGLPHPIIPVWQWCVKVPQSIIPFNHDSISSRNKYSFLHFHSHKCSVYDSCTILRSDYLSVYDSCIQTALRLPFGLRLMYLYCAPKHPLHSH